MNQEIFNLVQRVCIVENSNAMYNDEEIKKQRTKVANKAAELVRLLDVKCPNGITSNPYIGMCKLMIAVELASRLSNVPFAQEKGIKLTGVNTKDYTQCYTIVQNILNIKYVFFLLTFFYTTTIEDFQFPYLIYVFNTVV